MFSAVYVVLAGSLEEVALVVQGHLGQPAISDVSVVRRVQHGKLAVRDRNDCLVPLLHLAAPFQHVIAKQLRQRGKQEAAEAFPQRVDRNEKTNPPLKTNYRLVTSSASSDEPAVRGNPGESRGTQKHARAANHYRSSNASTQRACGLKILFGPRGRMSPKKRRRLDRSAKRPRAAKVGTESSARQAKT